MLSRIVAGSLGTALVGVLFGFVVASVVGIVAQDSGLFGGNGESPIARAYMLGLLQRNPSSISSIRPNQGIAQRAAELQGADVSRNTASMLPLSLTYLGGANAGGYSVQIYAIGVRGSNGADQFFPLALTIRGGQVIRSE